MILQIPEQPRLRKLTDDRKDVELFWAFLTQLQRLYRQEYRLRQNQRLIALEMASTWNSWQYLQECYPQFSDIIEKMYHAATQP